MRAVIPGWILAGLTSYVAIRSAIDGDARDAFEIGALALILLGGALALTRRFRGRAAFYADDGRPPRNSN